MSWAVRYSKAYVGAAHCDSGTYRRAVASLKSFIVWREKVFAKLRTNNIDIPVRAKRGRSLLESLAVSVPEKFKGDIIALLRARERSIPYLIPILKKAGMAFLAKRLRKPYPELESCISCTQFETVLAQAARQGIDRTSPDKIGVRIDFVIAAIARLVPEIEMESQFLRLCSERELRRGEIHESTLSEERVEDIG